VGRVHAPEIEDEPWCPRVLRDGLTDFLHIASDTFKLYDGALDDVSGLLQRHGHRQIVDLCSGGGGPVLRARRLIAARAPFDDDVTVTLTDLYPNLPAFDAASASDVRVHARRTPVDATNVPDDLVGVRTMWNALHHLRPELARRVVEDAARKRQPFIAVEVVERRPQTLAMIAGVPIATLALTPLARQLSIARLALTYGVPVIPLAVLWDGLMSCLRAYSVEELRALVDGVGDDGYAFRVERRDVSWLPARLTVLIGEPLNKST